MDIYYRKAIANVVRYGDTDIFPFPLENFIINDEVDAIIKILEARDADVGASLAACPPNNVGALAPVGYTGFRWAVQIDPIWNLLYLSWVLSIADQIEKLPVYPLDPRLTRGFAVSTITAKVGDGLWSIRCGC